MGQKSTIDFPQESVNIWRGIAIFTVVLVHLVAAFPAELYFQTSTAWWSVPFQSFGRFCVPLFLALSGYGLAKKYANKHLVWQEFFTQRILKLLPLYLLWSLVVYITLKITPEWRILREQALWQQLLLATADYQLYFVFLIFQLYLLFPIIHRFDVKGLRWFTFFTILIQATLSVTLRYLWFTPQSITHSWLDDQVQYRLFLNWLGYFSLGILLAKDNAFIRKSVSRKWTLIISLCLSLLWASYDSWHLLNTTQNVIFSTSFLRLPIVIFSSIFLILFPSFVQISLLQKKFWRPISWMGKNSYFIFLSHTTFLRVVLSLSALIQIVSLPTIALNKILLSFAIATLASIPSFAKKQTTSSLVDRRI